MREPTPGSTVSLREITGDTLRPILDLSVAHHQQDFVASNAVSIAQAHFAADAWFRGIYADNTPVGFVMLSLRPEKPQYYLWRFMIDERYQGMGFGAAAMRLVVDFVRRQPDATELLLSYVQAEGGPRDFYAELGFVDTGREHDGEWIMSLDLTGGGGSPVRG